MDKLDIYARKWLSPSLSLSLRSVRRTELRLHWKSIIVGAEEPNPVVLGLASQTQ
jgi:hypothetical protein